MLTRAVGFTLLELLLAVALSSVLLFAAFSGHSWLWAKAWQGQQLVRAEQSAHSLGHWLLRDIRRYGQHSSEPQVVWHEGVACLLYGDYGVRIRAGQLQWRPQEGECQSNGWLGLHDQHGFQVLALEWHSSNNPRLTGSQLCLRLQAKNGSVELWCGWI